MKKYLPYIIAVLLAFAVIAMVITGRNKDKERRLDERITLRKNDKIPYGTYVAYRELSHIFPDATISTNRFEPGYWDSLSMYDHDQALIIITPKFNADESEMKKLVDFIKQGNDVFISTNTISYSTGDFLECRVNSNSSNISSYYQDDDEDNGDSLRVFLDQPPFGKKTLYTYPGKSFDASFTSYNASTGEILGKDKLDQPNFIRLRSGKGNLYVHLAPLAFSNYFLLHKNNIDYYNKAMSVINPATTKVVWDEYYLNKRFLDENNPNRKNWFTVLMNERNGNGDHSFRAAFWLLIALLLLYVLQEMRRKQRVIPVVTRPRNDSMDFVKTIGRLYYDKSDHKNLSKKMAAYFLEHVRNKYKLLTGRLDEEFVKNLAHKSGVEAQELHPIISFINYIDQAQAVNHVQLMNFHRQLESFYKKA